ncbi:hypothetical protein ISF_05933 [Cordyceps fumosorosea ARSEF 2679]|uniref:DUF7730 domain-containing protein n=1 Tax=Cordyceps fumosorosea (strain ARSEF 2679) TaxID=1081104 RepID=A0A167STW1_CORFA|nr:hypothetical protein ISF_05933 [Cordyceps fumosorosea ARSEF 2679]OAA59922.1 hypothetical protein ISF_05933 [Cordyceps fumosorosea ARSEF 2679]
MAGRLSGWLHGFVNDGPPVLPRRRKHALTPTPSTTNLLSTQPRLDGTANSPLFQKLPAEIRIQILTAAFGERTLHMDVLLSYPPWRSQPVAHERAVPGHGGLFIEPSRAGDGKSYPVLDTTARQTWFWHGSVCHRNPPGTEDDGGRHSVQPCQDLCRSGITPDDTCSQWPGVSPEKCRIGAMGWLRSCRQAYLEGIDILYGTNTIHTASKALILDADRLLLPQRLAAITSLQVLWDFGSRPPWAESFPSKAKELIGVFEAMLRAVLSSFRGLKTLYISVQWTGREPQVTGPWWPGNGPDDAVERLLMRRVDAMVRQLPARVADFALAVPSSIYVEQCQVARETPGRTVEHVSDGARYERFWRPVEKGNAHAGYWVRLGQKDMKISEQSMVSDTLRPHEWILYAQ